MFRDGVQNASRTRPVSVTPSADGCDNDVTPLVGSDEEGGCTAGEDVDTAGLDIPGSAVVLKAGRCGLSSATILIVSERCFEHISRYQEYWYEAERWLPQPASSK